MRLTERDELILREVDRWRVCGSRHIRFLAGFSGQRATDRRLKILIEAGYLERKKFLYGVPSIYFLTAKGKSLIQAGTRLEKVKVEQIVHDMTVLDTAIYFMHKKGLSLQSITTEKQLHQLDGFGIRRHRPDFIFQQDNLTYCVEVELSQKAKNRLLNIIKDNYMEYDTQIWIVPDSQSVILQILKDSKQYYDNIQARSLQKINDYMHKML
ncbi:MAG: replication-relaxation family protein [Ruminococcus flavefaciens]|nr:replication-relaxation family protein [Ruminococcus flavefaciens]MCM1361357.1 replication-relaxation family protein [Clostridiales bacterium]